MIGPEIIPFAKTPCQHYPLALNPPTDEIAATLHIPVKDDIPKRKVFMVRKDHIVAHCDFHPDESFSIWSSVFFCITQQPTLDDFFSILMNKPVPIIADPINRRKIGYTIREIADKFPNFGKFLFDFSAVLPF